MSTEAHKTGARWPLVGCRAPFFFISTQKQSSSEYAEKHTDDKQDNADDKFNRSDPLCVFFGLSALLEISFKTVY